MVLVGAVARVGVENVSPACDRRQEHNPLYSIRTRHKLPLDPLLFYTCTFRAVLSYIRKKRAAY